MHYDLHVHTTASDGVETPAEVICKAVKAGLYGLAITDHDTVSGLEPADQFIKAQGLEIELIPGIELNTDYGKDEVHILGYFIDPSSESLLNRLSEIRDQRLLRAERMVAKLNNMGLSIELSLVKELARGDLVGRPHIARALQVKGYVNSEAEAFAAYIGKNKPAYVARYKFTPAEAINLIRDSGGIAVLAHPGLIKKPSIMFEIIELDIDGLEIYYPQHSHQQIISFLEVARQHNLLITGGSDYHGPGTSENRSHLGLGGINENKMNQIRDYHKRKK